MAICPICFRTLGTWTDDPILTKDGLAGASYKGFTVPNYIHIQEIQTVLHQLELDNIPTNLTTFSPINNTGNFQISEEHIKELRISIEKLLTATGMTKYQFFNYDEDGNYMGTTQTDWNDLNLEKDHYQVRAINLEDLRHFIQGLWKETWKDLSYNDSIIVNEGDIPGYISHQGIIHADHDWNYNGMYYLTASGGGNIILARKNASSIIACTSNFTWNGVANINEIYHIAGNELAGASLAINCGIMLRRNLIQCLQVTQLERHWLCFH